ncbi:MAG: hypothetical protein A2V90_07470 [Gammaproteobacteria bacterium RBG_16_57_12]|nr:MAG: hypothetical protein A2V90_07470 [Gammaproteobacteria bacterium RBG_16_57_12]
MLILQTSANHFDAYVMCHSAVMTLSAARQFLGAIESHMKSGILFISECSGFEKYHIHCHGAVVAGQAEQTDGARRVGFVIHGSAVIQTIIFCSGHVAIPALNYTTVFEIKILPGCNAGFFRR